MYEPDLSKDSWTRGKDALEVLMNHFPLETIEKLAKTVQAKPELVNQLVPLLDQLENL